VIALVRLAPAFVCAAALLAGCSRPDFSQSNKIPTSSDSAPDLPGWARGFEGKKIAAVGAQKLGACNGFVDGVLVRYAGARPGAQIAGWGWDSVAKTPYARVVLTDGGVVVGAGAGGTERPDVPKVIPAITSAKTGWTAVVHEPSGSLQGWGVSSSGVCLLGRFDLK
jgi:hypothetical protein